MDFDTMLYRDILPGHEFENLIPKTTCKKVASGTGNTDLSIVQMKEMVNEFYPQMKKVAAVLQNSSLITTAEAIKDFGYHHFQYKADDEDQFLRSPACSWYDRKNGIDCKSYSILASCLLTNLGINHYIRKIKQPGFAPTEWTHVYVIVPLDQQSNNLQNGYYTIDSTLLDDSEPAFIETKDEFMSLPHYKLNGGTGSFLSNFDLSSLGNLNSYVKNLLCGDSAYTETQMKNVIIKIGDYYNELLSKINTSVASGDDVGFAKAINEFFGNSKLFVTASEKTKAKGWNKCTSERIEANTKAFKFYRDTVGAALSIWLTDGFVKSPLPETSVNYTNENLFDRYGFRFANATPIITVMEPQYYYEPKAKTINAFQITPYVAEAANGGTTINPLQLLQGLTNVVGSFGPNSSGTPTDTTGTYTDETGGTPPPPITAGFGATGWILLAVAGTIAFSSFSDKNSVKK